MPHGSNEGTSTDTFIDWIQEICAAIAILSRALPSHGLTRIMGVWFAYTDIFVIAVAGISGLGRGLLSLRSSCRE